ncbi:MAG TPA: hypothetical protein DCE36_19445 [Pseudomonas sp.]|nr:hypothetical protein [Pseudomonas sp.]
MAVVRIAHGVERDGPNWYFLDHFLRRPVDNDQRSFSVPRATPRTNINLAAIATKHQPRGVFLNDSAWQ